ncbi:MULTISPECIES: response regulator transcription factor [Caloramator]|uniref:Stage 0 sporulation protein A homolog n=1 Tax=Caloramator australicus RC3 TaxID=857293 RepID=I7KTF6_9CLOT|nr:MULTISPECIES: response regulator transcription factor [Caloramator]MDO6353927.1 response regulator transcription factor [Caloramator sp. CAR-1]CCJ33028.1 Response regulator receiver [Caloramator australicus RC3]
MNKVLIIEDEYKIVDVLEAYLKKEGYIVFTEASGLKGLQAYLEKQPDIIILDLMLPDLTGEEVCKRIRKESKVPILMLTAKSMEEDILKGFDIGADDYVTKPFSPKEVVARVKALIKRSKDEVLPLIIYEGLEIDCEGRRVKLNGEEIDLTPTEFKILINMAKNAKKVFTREELINNVFGMDYDGYDRSIDTHIKNLRHKLKEDPKYPKYIKTIRGLGYKFGGE